MSFSLFPDSRHKDMSSLYVLFMKLSDLNLIIKFKFLFGFPFSTYFHYYKLLTRLWALRFRGVFISQLIFL